MSQVQPVRLTRIDLVPSDPHPAADPLRRPLARQAIRVLKIPRQDFFELLHRLVMLLDQLGQGADATTDVNCGRRVRDVETEEQAVEASIGLKPLADLRDLPAHVVSTSEHASRRRTKYPHHQ